MTRQLVPLFKNTTKSIAVDDKATEGAVVGQNLVLADGTVLFASDIVTSQGTANDVRNILGVPVEELFNSSGELLIDLVSWENIAGIPANIQEVEALTGSGIVRKGSPWTAGVKVAYAEIQDVSASDRVLGRSTAGAGVIEEIPCTATGRLLLNSSAITNFTPTIIGAASAGAGTYTTQVGRYQQFGKLVYYEATLVWTAHTGTGNMRIAGLPIAAAGSGRWAQSVQVSNLTWGAGQLHASIIGGESVIRLFNVDSGAAEAEFALDTAGTIHVSGFYEVA